MATFGLRGQESNSFSSVDHSVNGYDQPTPLASGESSFSVPVAGDDEDVEPTQAQSQQKQTSFNFDENDHLVAILTSYASPTCEFEMRKDHPGGRWTVGRGKKCSFIINDNQISTHHCTLIWNGRMGQQSEVLLEDTSTNGTQVDNVFLKRGKTILRSGSSISLANVAGGRFIFRDIEGFSPRYAREVWAKYDIGVELGRGAFAKVNQCVERETGREYAIKVIDKIRFWTAGKAIKREISILKELSQFRHENIVSLYEYFDEKESLYLVFERLRGGDLFNYIVTQGPIPEARVRPMAAQICQAVAYIHSKDVAHRDLKPENVLLTDDSDWPKCKIADFGLAKIVNDQTFLKTTCGTPAYLAPEVALRPDTTQAYDQKVDSWSLGIIFFCMLTNSTPFSEAYDQTKPESERNQYFSSRVLRWDYLSGRGLSPVGLDFLQCLLEFEPDKRCSVEEMLDHAWIGDHVPPYSKVFPPPPPSDDFSPTPYSTDQDTLACSQSFQHLNLSDGLSMPIPGLTAVAQDSIEPTSPPHNVAVPSFTSDSSITAKMPGAYPKAPKAPVTLLPAIAEGDSGALLENVDSAATLKRKNCSDTVPVGSSPFSDIAGSSPLSDLPDDDEEVADSSNQDDKENKESRLETPYTSSDVSEEQNPKRRRTTGPTPNVPPKAQGPASRGRAKAPTTDNGTAARKSTRARPTRKS